MSSDDHKTHFLPLPETLHPWPNLVLGITGTVAGGKSTVCDILKARGLPIIDTDQLAKEAVTPGTDILKQLVNVFGIEILLKDGTLNRKMMLIKILDSPMARKQVEDILHPHIFQKMSQWLNEQKKLGNEMAGVEVPLLFEKGWGSLFHRTLAVLAPLHIALERLQKNRGLSKETAERLINIQMSNEEKAKLADYVIWNDGTREELGQKVEAFWKWLQETSG